MAITLQAEKRSVKPKSVRKRLRQSGKVPAVIYGKDMSNNLPIAVYDIEMTKILRDEGNYAVLELDVDKDESYQVMVFDVQRDPIKNALVHVDFKTIRMDEKVNSEVTIEIVGKPAGASEGGVLQQALRSLEISCLPNERPDVISCDVSALNIGDSLTVADLNVPDNVDVLNDPEENVVSVVPPAQEEPVVSDEPAGEPELVEKTNDDAEDE